MIDLIEFLNARLDEREAKAEAALFDPRWYVHVEPTHQQIRDGNRVALASGAESALEHIAGNDPAYVLADIEAKRRIIGRYVELRGRCAAARSEYSDWLEGKPTPEPGTWITQADPAIRDELLRTLRLLALPYAHHPDYREEWKP